MWIFHSRRRSRMYCLLPRKSCFRWPALLSLLGGLAGRFIWLLQGLHSRMDEGSDRSV
jgi:hypothetical protein